MLYSSLTAGVHTSMGVALITEEGTDQEKTMYVIGKVQNVRMYVVTYVHMYIKINVYN